MDLSEREAAVAIGVSQPTLRAVEKDDVGRIGLEVASRFVRALDGIVSLDDFLTTRKRSA